MEAITGKGERPVMENDTGGAPRFSARPGTCAARGSRCAEQEIPHHNWRGKAQRLYHRLLRVWCTAAPLNYTNGSDFTE
jgi:hypothetical protein